MTADANARFQRVDAVFDAVLDVPTAEQAAFIDRVCGNEAEVRAEVLELLNAHLRAGSILDTPAVRLASISGESVSGEGATPERIGPFRVVRAIGQGGMGQVFLGSRDDGQFEQRVALKLIRHPVPGLVRRFLEERRILALLEHPNVARLVDGGIADDGLPYFAMEFVDGEPIDRYCESRQLSLDDRLALFNTVCDAVSYAHQHLIIHRDLKPANILVRPDGQVKLLDFGIAKLLDAAGDNSATDETRTGFRVMTPDVAAPEQVLGRPVSTATDVYALGILLYQLLAGERPYDVRGMSFVELARTVSEYQPPPPSTKAPAAFRRRLRGDLDLIVMTALQKQEERRYQSPAALAQDVQRWREGRAILARPDSARYRLGKFAVRHRGAVAIAGVIMIAVAASAARERLLRHKAEVAATKATEVENFLVRVFDVADPFAWSEADRGTISARDLLDRGAKRIDSTLVSQPEVQADLRAVLGRVYTNLGLLQQATPLLRESLAQRTKLLGAQDTSVATAMDLLGKALAQQNDYAEAERLLRAGLEQRRRLLGNNDNATAESMEHLATLLEDRNQYAPAESLHREVVRIRQTIFGDSSAEYAQAVNNLALIRSRRGGYDEADTLYRRALAIDIRRLGEQHALTAAAMQNLATNSQFRGQMDEAEQFYRRSLAAKRVALGNAHPSVTISLNNFGSFLAQNRGRLDEAESLTREALALDRKMFGNRHSYVAESVRNLGVILTLRGQFAQADSAFAEALSINRSLFTEPHERIALVYHQMAQVRYQVGDSLEALRLQRMSAAQYRQLLGDDHLNTIATTGNVARMLSDGLGVAEAESLARAQLARLDSSKAAHRPHYIPILRTLGWSIYKQRRTDEALPLLERSLEMTRKQWGEESVRMALPLLSYGTALAAKGRYAEAESLLRAGNTIAQKHRVDQPQLAARGTAALAAFNARALR